MPEFFLIEGSSGTFNMGQREYSVVPKVPRTVLPSGAFFVLRCAKSAAHFTALSVF